MKDIFGRHPTLVLGECVEIAQQLANYLKIGAGKYDRTAMIGLER